MADDQPPGPGSWRKIDDGPWVKVEFKTARCQRPGCGHIQQVHGGRTGRGACNGSHYGGYGSNSCYCSRFKASL